VYDPLQLNDDVRSGRGWELILHISVTHEHVIGFKDSQNDALFGGRLMDVSLYDLYTPSRHGAESRDRA
jgi:hypothetical protein